MICASIARTRHKMMITEYRAAAEQGADLVELRLDFLRRNPDVGRLIDQRPCPVVVSCRRPQDGGRFQQPEEKRQQILRSAIVAGADYVDLESDIASAIPRHGQTKRIVSYHNFQTTPQNLEMIHAEMRAQDPDIIKIVTMAERPSDNVRILQLVAKSDFPTVGFCMGDLGIPSRVLAAKYGAPFVYAAFNRERILAPGQLTFEELRDVYRFNSLDRDTEVFAVIGDPVAQSLSPHVHNSAFDALGMNRVYVSFRVTVDEFPRFFQDMDWLAIKGLSVTIPHKQMAVNKVQHADGGVRMVGALNTMIRRNEGWEGHNTDYRAAMTSLETVAGAEAGESGPLSGKHAVVLGAGGVARAVAFGLVRRGSIVTVTSRNRDRAESLAKSAGCRHVPWGRRMSGICDILVNCTPVGMFPEVNESPVASGFLREGMVVFDMVYHPENTMLIKEARAHGCRIVSGVEMFVRQAALQFQIFTEVPAPEALMRDVVRRCLSPLRMPSPRSGTAESSGAPE